MCVCEFEEVGNVNEALKRLEGARHSWHAAKRGYIYKRIPYNTIQYKYEYHYSGINPVEFLGHSRRLIIIIIVYK